MVLDKSVKKKSSTKKERELYSEKAYNEIKRRILSNELPPGYQVMEDELAKILKMSRTPTHEALLRLANEGLVEIKPRRGIRVKPISQNDIREIYQIMTSLEAYAAQLCASQNLGTRKINHLKKAIAEMDTALEKDDLMGWADADADFHNLLVQYCGNERLSKLAEIYVNQVHRIRVLTLKLRPKPTDSNKDHRNVLDAIENGDGETAHKIHFAHRERNGIKLLEILSDYGLAFM